MKKTISFASGRGSIGHNNREFFSDNIDQSRTKNNIVLKSEKLEEAYSNLFLESIEKYNSLQKRKDRKIDGIKGYMSKLKNSKNNEKLFYETVIMIGDEFDSGVITKGGKETTKILEEYAKSFQKRNPNLYLFNSVIHLDESTPHLHIDYIPVASGYKKGLEKRNSISKALNNMGYESKNRKENSLVSWSEKEREYVKELCEKNNVKTKKLGIKRPRYEISEYKTMANLIRANYEPLNPKIDYKKIPFTDNIIMDKKNLDKMKRTISNSKKFRDEFKKLSEKTDSLIKSLEVEKRETISMRERVFEIYDEQMDLNINYKKECEERKRLEQKNKSLLNENKQLESVKENLSEDLNSNKNLLKDISTLSNFILTKVSFENLDYQEKGIYKTIENMSKKNMSLKNKVSTKTFEMINKFKTNEKFKNEYGSLTKKSKKMDRDYEMEL